MTSNADLRWQRLSETYDGNQAKRGSAYRAEVPGGWLVTLCLGKPSKRQLTAVAFVPDAAHEWKLATESAPEAPATAADSTKSKKKKKKKDDKPGLADAAAPAAKEHAA